MKPPIKRVITETDPKTDPASTWVKPPVKRVVTEIGNADILCNVMVKPPRTGWLFLDEP